MSRSGASGRTVTDRLDRAYAAIPVVNCRGLCTDSCHSLVMTPAEQRRIRAATGIRLPLVHAGGPCGALDEDGRCQAYRERPALCRLFGSVDDPLMRCPFGCVPEGGLLDSDEGHRVLDEVRRIDGAPRRAADDDVDPGMLIRLRESMRKR